MGAKASKVGPATPTSTDKAVGGLTMSAFEEEVKKMGLDDRIPQQRLWLLFKFFDTDESGVIDPAELQNGINLLTRLLERASDGSVEAHASPEVLHSPEGVLELLGKRPKRSGKWFVCHQDKLSSINYEEVCDIYEEFLKHHPNGGAATAGFVAVRLSDGQIEKQRDLIRISSYRWKDVKGVGPNSALEPNIPSNYLWFLEHIRERGQILWMDWMANVGVNVPVPTVVGYMGSLYAKNIVLGAWMYDLDYLVLAESRAWIFQEMSFGDLDQDAMGGLFEQLRKRGHALSQIPFLEGSRGSRMGDYRVRRNDPEDAAVVKAYLLGCGAMAALLTRRAFGSVAEGCEWYRDTPSNSEPHLMLLHLGVHQESASAMEAEAQVQLPGVDEKIWSKLILMCSTQKSGEVWVTKSSTFDWTHEPWMTNRPKLLELVCAAPYHCCKSLDELVRRYAHGLLGAALGCLVSFESDRLEAVTSVLRAIASEKFKVELGPEELLSRVWQTVLTDKTDFGVAKVNAPIVPGSSSVVLGPLQLHGTLITYSTNDPYKLKCHYETTDGSVVDFDGAECIAIDVVKAAGVVRGIVRAEVWRGLPNKPMPKLQDAATGAAVDMCLCVPRAEPFATIATNVMFTLLTQGGRLISMQAAKSPRGYDFWHKTPPKPNICFYGSKDT